MVTWTGRLWLAVPLLVVAALAGRASAQSVCVASGVLVERTVWDTGMSADMKLQFASSVSSWTAEVTFDRTLTGLDTWVADIATADNTVYTFTNKGYNGAQSAGSELKVAFNAYFNTKADVISIKLNGEELCTGTAPSTTTTTSTTSAATTTTTSTAATTTAAPPTAGTTAPPTGLPYDYSLVVEKSLLFYEAQRSGPLPASNRVPWRGDSALADGSDVGDGDIDHAWWGRPEDMAMSRPSYKITASAAGSDLAAETAAALAAASLVFRRSDPTYADLLLTHAAQLYQFADQYRGLYHDSIADAAQFYRSWSGFGDELTWAAAWLHRATDNSSYLSAAEQHFQAFPALGQRASEFSWDGKHVGAQLLLYEATGDGQYGQLVSQFCDWLVSGAPRTPQGLLFLQPWGSLRHAANAALVCLQAAEAGLSPTTYRALAKQQINLMLGDAGRSFVVGFGENPPLRPHHKAASCPSAPAACSWDQLNTAEPNPHVLNGALVGGPDSEGNYEDVRTDYVHNEVTTDYNAGFQGAVAGLLSLHVRGLYPA
ncbi:Endoglucanase E-4 [Amphibalanus amphitrite]|uniref:Endoglucanase n=1 Tax=Amphibalanus amphitrite TaxID=1232801 RepID=A0A6A4X1X2_AMPAM|nr:Endoglucanase E-4 [Amphibalanus amphitrite]